MNRPLTDTEVGVLMSSMSDSSCAMTLGRSVAWVSRARSPKPEARSPKPEAVAAGLSAVKPQVVRYARWFLAADWPLGLVARLFDLDPETLAEAVL
ncbi:hypothetical protein [Brevundimonas sp.]|uniref:hypothetical protein n=1 Tax=Brevundimonas sp. TaxID=1871086 RepID=UPI002898F52B|nr:hypothetical protein [Brevundimonas sp.]